MATVFDQKLYNKDSRDRLRFWRIYVIGDQFFQEDGLVDGKVKQGKPTTAKPKNIGRANATTGEEQAILEARAKVEKKLKSGYVEDINKASKYAFFFEPMLAESFDKRRDKIDYSGSIAVQPKLDGARCIARWEGDRVVLRSRKGEEFLTVPHINKFLEKHLPKGHILDGELYNHDLRDNFNKIMSLIRKTKNLSSEVLKSTEKDIQYYVYDMLLNENDDSVFNDRDDNVAEFFEDIKSENSPLVEVFTAFVNNESEVFDQHYKFIKEGYEGSIVRVINAVYKRAGRSTDLLKLKDFQDAEYKILDIEEGQGNRSGMAGKLVFKSPSGKEFRSGIAGGEELYKDMWKNKDKYIGKVATLEFFEFTEVGGDIPRFPVFKAIRDYE